jgi:hypothetical protein
LFSFNAGEQAFHTVKPRRLRLAFRIQNLAPAFNPIGNVSDGFPAGLVSEMLIA